MTACLLKICGITVLADARLCREHGVDYVGFNFYPGSKRYIAPAAARAIWLEACADSQAAKTQVVAVFVDPKLGELEAALRAFPEIAAVQIHAHGSSCDWAKIRQALGPRALWQAIAVAGIEDVQRAAAAECELVLFDSAAIATGHTVAGGSGQSFDWSWLTAYKGARPFGLAGGLGPGRMAKALAYAPALVDLCSRIEVSPGRKSPLLLAAVVDELRAAKTR